jgi:hypothetical protein
MRGAVAGALCVAKTGWQEKRKFAVLECEFVMPSQSNGAEIGSMNSDHTGKCAPRSGSHGSIGPSFRTTILPEKWFPLYGAVF